MVIWEVCAKFADITIMRHLCARTCGLCISKCLSANHPDITNQIV
ncbi:MAG: hypothetical protein K2I51_03085 [Muribaculaceae bacterium]|nr:hypothetical protein [Muribaculaceae bacterium]